MIRIEKIKKKGKKMITVKKILLLLSVIIFTSTSYNAANAARDCSDPKGFHAKMACKIQGKSFKKESSGILSSNACVVTAVPTVPAKNTFSALSYAFSSFFIFAGFILSSFL